MLLQLQDDLSFSNSSGLFAEALILPYNLIPIETYEHGELTEVFLNNQNKLSDCTGQLKDSIEGWSKQSKLIQASNIVQHSDSVNVSREFERSCHLCCSLTFRSNNCKWSQLPVYLYNANGIIMKDIFHNQSDSRVLLEFGSNNFSKYQVSFSMILFSSTKRVGDIFCFLVSLSGDLIFQSAC